MEIIGKRCTVAKHLFYFICSYDAHRQAREAGVHPPHYLPHEDFAADKHERFNYSEGNLLILIG